jgi:hypothetical protein
MCLPQRRAPPPGGMINVVGGGSNFLGAPSRETPLALMSAVGDSGRESGHGNIVANDPEPTWQNLAASR